MSLTDLIPGMSQAKLIVGAIGLAAVAVPTVGLVITRHTLAGVRDWQADVIGATGEAAHLAPGKRFAAKIVPEQIREFGRALDKVEAAGIAARNAGLARNTRVETAQNTATKESGDAIETELARARADAAAYSRGLRDARQAAANRGCSVGAGAAAGAGDRTEAPDRPGGVSLLDEDDVRICTDNTVKARGWQGFDGRLSAIPR